MAEVGPKSTPTASRQGVRALTDGLGWERGEGLHAETAQSAWTVILELVISGLTRIILF